jgi:hypothetical protein
MVLTLSSISQAGPLGVEINPFPVIQIAFVTSSYDAVTGAFLADGFMRTLDTGSGRVSYPNPKFRLLANINNSGVATGGSFSIDGDLLGSSILLGFAYIPGTLEFLFGSTTGTLVSDGTYDATMPIDVMFSGTATALPTSFASNWQSTTYSSALIREDPPTVTAVPEPSTLILTLVAAGGATFRRFRPRPSIGAPQTIS